MRWLILSLKNTPPSDTVRWVSKIYKYGSARPDLYHKGMLNPGAAAPDFELPAHTGEKIRLSSFRGSKAVVLFFYPKDETPGCTKEVCAFRDSYADFASQNTVVLGVSSDSGTSHDRFANKHNLPFPLLSDDGTLRRAYGVGRTLGIIAGRATFVIDKEGVIRAAFSSQFQPGEHVRTALAALQGVDLKAF